jgi:hypothetical protein
MINIKEDNNIRYFILICPISIYRMNYKAINFTKIIRLLYFVI